MSLKSETLLERYRILAPLGVGGMGEVYRAKDLRLGRDIAIKVLPEHLASDSSALARFEREAKAVAALSHPNILAIHDFGADGGVSFAVTELLEGETLRSRLAGGALTWRKAVEISRAIAEGLAAAHSRGIIHRDLKPENVFITHDGRVKILDFGLARWEEPSASEEETSAPTTPAPTEPGTVLGTMGYMSPEQVRGQPADARSDIFSFGAVLYEMIAGRRAFSGESAAEKMAAILRDEPPDLSRSVAGVPPELARVVPHCLEKNPGERFQSARDVAFALQAVAEGSAVSEPPPTRQKPKGRIKSLAVLPFANVGGDAEMDYLSEGITETLISSLSRLPKLRVMARSTVFRYKADSDPQQVGRELDVAAVLTGKVVLRGEALAVQAELVDAGTGWRLWGDRYQRTMADVLEVEEQIAREIGEKLRLALRPAQKKRLAQSRTVNRDAYEIYLKGRYYWNKSGVPNIQRALEYFESAIAKDPAYALAYTGISDCYAALGMDKYGALSPAEAFPKAKAAALKALEVDERLVEGHTSLGFVCQMNWEWSAAEEALRKAIRGNPNYAQAHEIYGFYLAAVGRFDGAVVEMTRAQELDPLSLNMLASFGWVYLAARRYKEAIEQCHRALELDPNFVQAHLWLGLSQTENGMASEAIATFQNAAAITNRNATILGGLGIAHVRAGEAAEARKILEELEDRSARGQYVTTASMVMLYTALGQKDAAFDWLEKAYTPRASFLTGLKVYSFLDSLRPDPRYDDLLRRIGFP